MGPVVTPGVFVCSTERAEESPEGWALVEWLMDTHRVPLQVAVDDANGWPPHVLPGPLVDLDALAGD